MMEVEGQVGSGVVLRKDLAVQLGVMGWQPG